MRREDRGKTRWGGPVGEGDRGGHAGEAAGPFWPLPSPEGTRPRRPGGAGCFRLSPSEKREAQPMGLTLALQKVHHPRRGLSAGAPGRRWDGGILEG
jgi:hypothetical protein